MNKLEAKKLTAGMVLGVRRKPASLWDTATEWVELVDPTIRTIKIAGGRSWEAPKDHNGLLVKRSNPAFVGIFYQPDLSEDERGREYNDYPYATFTGEALVPLRYIVASFAGWDAQEAFLAGQEAEEAERRNREQATAKRLSDAQEKARATFGVTWTSIDYGGVKVNEVPASKVLEFLATLTPEQAAQPISVSLPMGWFTEEEVA